MLFYQQVGPILPIIEAKKQEAEKVGQEEPTVVKTILGPIGDGKFKDLYPQKVNFGPQKDLEVAENVYYTGRVASCAVCGDKTTFATYLPELAHVCSKQCSEKIRL